MAKWRVDVECGKQTLLWELGQAKSMAKARSSSRSSRHWGLVMQLQSSLVLVPHHRMTQPKPFASSKVVHCDKLPHGSAPEQVQPPVSLSSLTNSKAQPYLECICRTGCVSTECHRILRCNRQAEQQDRSGLSMVNHTKGPGTEHWGPVQILLHVSFARSKSGTTYDSCRRYRNGTASPGLALSERP